MPDLWDDLVQQHFHSLELDDMDTFRLSGKALVTLASDGPLPSYVSSYLDAWACIPVRVYHVLARRGWNGFWADGRHIRWVSLSGLTLLERRKPQNAKNHLNQDIQFFQDLLVSDHFPEAHWNQPVEGVRPLSRLFSERLAWSQASDPISVEIRTLDVSTHAFRTNKNPSVPPPLPWDVFNLPFDVVQKIEQADDLRLMHEIVSRATVQSRAPTDQTLHAIRQKEHTLLRLRHVFPSTPPDAL
jgi:hypothetical protein